MNMQASLQASIQAAVEASKKISIDDSPPVNASPLIDAIANHEALHEAVQQRAHNTACDMAINAKLLEPVDAVLIPQAPDDDVVFKNISDRAMTFKLSMSKFNVNVKDVDRTVEYGAGHVTKRLFKGTDNLVAKAAASYGALYSYVHDNTLPWDVGVRIVNATFFKEFSAQVRVLRAECERVVSLVEADWDNIKAADFRRMEQIGVATNNPDLANWSDYPDDIGACYSVTTYIEPIAQTSSIDPRWGVDPADVEEYNQRLRDANTNSGKHVVSNLIAPQEAAIAKLSVPIGDDNSTFRETLISNMVGVADRMSRANVCDDPAIAQQITDLSSLAGKLDANHDILRNSQTARTQAVTDISSLVNQMRGFA